MAAAYVGGRGAGQSYHHAWLPVKSPFAVCKLLNDGREWDARRLMKPRSRVERYDPALEVL